MSPKDNRLFVVEFPVMRERFEQVDTIGAADAEKTAKAKSKDYGIATILLHGHEYGTYYNGYRSDRGMYRKV